MVYAMFEQELSVIPEVSERSHDDDHENNSVDSHEENKGPLPRKVEPAQATMQGGDADIKQPKIPLEEDKKEEDDVDSGKQTDNKQMLLYAEAEEKEEEVALVRDAPPILPLYLAQQQGAPPVQAAVQEVNNLEASVEDQAALEQRHREAEASWARL